MVKILGIDEAGRGPVIGPMVICGFMIDSKDENSLPALGVKDSKMLSSSQREAVFEKLIKKGIYRTIVVEPEEIDKAVEESDETNLNWLEAEKASEIINILHPEIVYIDCPSPNIQAFTSFIRQRLKDKTLEVIATHKADVNYPCVSAASIIAKVTRDRIIDKLKKQYNIDFGSGYPSDPTTRDFLEENWNKYNFFRKSWQSYKEVMKKAFQKTLGEF